MMDKNRYTVIMLVAWALSWGLVPAAAQEGMPADIQAVGLPTDSVTAEEDKKERSFDNSRTDINLYNKTVSDKKRVKSLFYTETEIRDVHLAVNTYLKNIGRGGDLTFDEEAFLSRLGGLKNLGNNAKEGQNRLFTYPQFFLNSLVYYGVDNWLVWVNGEKITPQTPRESKNIHVMEVTPDQVTLTWFPLEMHRVTEIWKLFPNDKVTVDTVRGQVTFTLKPNQTFSSYTMTPLEGKVLPVTVDITKSVVPYTFEATEIESPENAAPVIDKVIQEEP